MYISIQPGALQTISAKLKQTVEQLRQTERTHILLGYGDEHLVSSNPHSKLELMTLGDKKGNILHAAELNLQGWTFDDPTLIFVKLSSTLGGKHEHKP